MALQFWRILVLFVTILLMVMPVSAVDADARVDVAEVENVVDEDDLSRGALVECPIADAPRLALHAPDYVDPPSCLLARVFRPPRQSFV